jgi:hypothetical protein
VASRLEQLAADVRQVGSSTGPFRHPIEDAGRRAERLSQSIPRSGGAAGSAAGSLRAAAAECKRAALDLDNFAEGCRSFAERLTGGSSGAASLTPDAAAVADMTGDYGHAEVNGALWHGVIRGTDGTPDVEGVAARAVAFQKALQGFPLHPGTAFRGMTLTDDQRARYAGGESVVEPAFTQSSATPDREFGGNTLFVIDSKSARHVGRSSAKPNEDEVAFKMSTRFDVLSHEWVDGLEGGAEGDGGRWLIYLVER